MSSAAREGGKRRHLPPLDGSTYFTSTYIDPRRAQSASSSESIAQWKRRGVRSAPSSLSFLDAQEPPETSVGFGGSAWRGCSQSDTALLASAFSLPSRGEAPRSRGLPRPTGSLELPSSAASKRRIGSASPAVKRSGPPASASWPTRPIYGWSTVADLSSLRRAAGGGAPPSRLGLSHSAPRGLRRPQKRRTLREDLVLSGLVLDGIKHCLLLSEAAQLAIVKRELWLHLRPDLKAASHQDRLCKHCGDTFTHATNVAECRYHPGRELINFTVDSVAVGMMDISWSCCHRGTACPIGMCMGIEREVAEGCCLRKHSASGSAVLQHCDVDQRCRLICLILTRQAC
mmetsp:Transcript_66590/g.124266  ORF Transcript_66590/g.124266 Transcript_66590/m.124266 type:complete len:344 (-) Transcript_66590:11-1042(-)